MQLKTSSFRAALGLTSLVMWSGINIAFAAPEEIQVYADEFADKAKFGLDLHTNYVPLVQNNSTDPPLRQLRLTPELSYGLSDHFETAAYFLSNRPADGQLQTDGVKLRIRWRPYIPTEETVWYTAINVEIGKLSRRFNPDGSNGEIKGILSWKSTSWSAALNLNIDRPLQRNKVQPTTLELDSKVAYKLHDRLRLGVENYAFLGPVHGEFSSVRPSRSTFAVTDFSVGKWDLNFGIGRVRGDVPDRTIIKAIIGLPI